MQDDDRDGNDDEGMDRSGELRHKPGSRDDDLSESERSGVIEDDDSDELAKENDEGMETGGERRKPN